MEPDDAKTQKQKVFPIETVIGTNKERLEIEYPSMQSISPEIPIFFNNMYYGNVPLQQYYLASFFYPYLYNSYWVPIHPNFHPPNTAAHYCDENQSSKTTKMPVHIDAGPPKRVKQPFGPEGANIYISHLPRFVDDEYLRSLFEPYGRVLSTKVNIDNRTGESKGIGFVSYDSREAAQRAIGAMNGHKIDGKRLRVQLKRSKANNATPPKEDNEGH